MPIINGFSRNEVIDLTGLKLHKISYLDRAGLISPKRTSLPGQKRTFLSYSWLQLLELKAVAKLREGVSLQSLRKVVDFLESNCEDSLLSNKNLILLGGDVFWVNPDFSDLPGIMMSLSKNPGQLAHSDLMLIPNMKQELFKAAETSNVVDFESFKERATMAIAV